MNTLVNKNKAELINYGLLIFVFCLLTLSIILHPKVADDYCLSSGINSSTPFKQYLINYYNGTNGRLFSGVFYYLFFYSTATTIFCKLISAILFFYIVSVASKLFMPTLNKAAFLFYFILIYCLIWFGFPAINETVYWSNASVVYLWGLAFFIFYIQRYFKYIFNDTQNSNVNFNSKIIVYLFPFIAVFAGCIQEQFLLPATTVFAFLLLINYKQKTLKQIPISLYIGILGYYTGFGLMIFSPANLNRFHSVVGAVSPSVSKKEIVFRIYDYIINSFLRIDGTSIIPWLLLVTFVLLFIFKSKLNVKKNVKFLVFASMAIGAVLPILLTGCKNTAPRTYFYFSYFLVLAVLSLQTNYIVPTFTKTISRFSLLLLVFLVLDTLNATRASYYYYKQNADREKIIYLEKKQGQTTLELQPYFSKLHRTMFVNDINTKKEDIWINECICQYYKVDSINVVINK